MVRLFPEPQITIERSASFIVLYNVEQHYVAGQQIPTAHHSSSCISGAMMITISWWQHNMTCKELWI